MLPPLEQDHLWYTPEEAAVFLSLSCFSLWHLVPWGLLFTISPHCTHAGTDRQHLHTTFQVHMNQYSQQCLDVHILAHINLLIFKQSVIHFLPENASASQTVRNVVKMDCIQMLQSLLRLVGCLPMYFPIAVLYQAGKLAHWEVGLLGCLYSGKCSSYSIHDGDRNRLWPQETFIRDCYEEQVWKKKFMCC